MNKIHREESLDWRIGERDRLYDIMIKTLIKPLATAEEISEAQNDYYFFIHRHDMDHKPKANL